MLVINYKIIPICNFYMYGGCHMFLNHFYFHIIDRLDLILKLNVKEKHIAEKSIRCNGTNVA